METKTKSNSDNIQQLFAAELQFRLASAVRLASAMKRQPLDLPVEWVHGKHRVKYNEVALRKDQADYAAWHLSQSATYLLAAEIKNAIVSAYPECKDFKNHPNERIRNAFQIARYIRNAFTHHPFKPFWKIDKEDQNKKFAVLDIIELDTTDLNDKPFQWQQYGGPLAILRLAQFVRFEVLKDLGKRPAERILSKPKNEYIQQGSLILKKVKKIPKGAKKINIQKGKAIDLGRGHKLIIR